MSQAHIKSGHQINPGASDADQNKRPNANAENTNLQHQNSVAANPSRKLKESQGMPKRGVTYADNDKDKTI